MKTLIECCVIAGYSPRGYAGYIYRLTRFVDDLMWVYDDKKLSDNHDDIYGTKEEIAAICKERALPVVDRSTDLAFLYREGDLDN